MFEKRNWYIQHVFWVEEVVCVEDRESRSTDVIVTSWESQVMVDARVSEVDQESTLKIILLVHFP